jgi:uncharacterized protein
MFQLILLAVIIYILFKWLRLSPPAARKARTFKRQGSPQDSPVEEMVQDPVCGTWVPASQAVILTREKETFYFCSEDCRDKFRQIPKTN